MSIAAEVELGRPASLGLAGRVALIADGSEPLGAETARTLAAGGATVCLCGESPQRLSVVAADIAAKGGDARIVARDRFGPDGSLALAGPTENSLRQIDIFINNVPFIPGRSLDAGGSDCAREVSSILTTSLSSLQNVASMMRRRKYGRIVNVISLSYLGISGQIDAAATYAGLFGVTRSAALETARDGITVNSIVKGDISAADPPQDDVARVIATIPVKRIGAARDVIHAIKYFVSPATSYVTGQTLFVCGGKSAYFSLSV